MIALLSTLLGFLSSTAPEFFKMFTQGRDRAHEITLLKLQMEYDASNAAAGRSARLAEIEMAAEIAESQTLNARPGSGENRVGILWVDALAGSVRPVITYAFFVLYFVVKCAQFHVLLSPALPWAQPITVAQALVALWSEEDIAIFSAVIGFWFGNRTMMKARRAS